MLCFGITSFSQESKDREEFNGPLRGWANVKTRFHAAGDGVTDDTKAIQTALDSLTCTQRVPFNQNKETGYLVIYLPAGTYNISQTLSLVGKIGVTFIGEDPLKTIIKWVGGDNDTMFFSNRTAYFKVSRLTWDANNKKNIEAVGMHYKDTQEPNFAPTSVEFSDMIFKGNPSYGIAGGTFAGEGTGMMDAEVVIRRCKFYSASTAAIFIKGFNALDYWIWDCEFRNSQIGVQSILGNYHIYRSHFFNSVFSDVYTKDALYSSVRGCYSENSQAFSVDDGASCNAFKRIFQKNYVKDCKSIPIQYHHQGKITLLDNHFVNNNQTQQFTVDYSSWCKGNYDILSIENKYAEEKPHHLRADFASTVHSISDMRFDKKTMKAPAISKLQPFLAYVKRKIFEVPDGADTKTIQGIINEASELNSRAVIHFPMGTFQINKTLQIPAGSNIQIVGDGMLYATVFLKDAPESSESYYFRIAGPSYITIKDIQVGQNPDADRNHAFLFTGIDQPDSEVRLEQIYTLTNNTLLIDRLDHTYFEKNLSFFSRGNKVIGGDLVRAGTGKSRLYCFGGQSAGASLQNNATMVAKDCWYEGMAKKDYLPLDLTNGYGNLTVDGALYSPSDADSNAIIKVSNFRGRISLSDMYLMGTIDVKPNSPNLEMLIWNIHYYYKMNPLSFLQKPTKSKIAVIGISSQCFKSKDANCADESPLSINDSLNNISHARSFISKLSMDNRKAMPRRYKTLKDGVSNIFISRVSTLNGNTSYTFRK
jgi:hypothetical protein